MGEWEGKRDGTERVSMLAVLVGVLLFLLLVWGCGVWVVDQLVDL